MVLGSWLESLANVTRSLETRNRLVLIVAAGEILIVRMVTAISVMVQTAMGMNSILRLGVSAMSNVTFIVMHGRVSYGPVCSGFNLTNGLNLVTQ